MTPWRWLTRGGGRVKAYKLWRRLRLWDRLGLQCDSVSPVSGPLWNVAAQRWSPVLIIRCQRARWHVSRPYGFLGYTHSGSVPGAGMSWG